jgi:hypothetical protein
MADKKMTPKQMKLAAMSGDKGKITRGDVITAAKMNAAKKKPTKAKKK